MADDDAPEDPQSRANDILTRAKLSGDQPSPENRKALLDALTTDLAAAPSKATVVDARLEKIETQTRAISEAVLAIAETAPGVTVAVDALKKKM